jgi:hypothetical protein
VRQWINSELSQQSIKIIGVIEQPHVRPWSTVLRIPTYVGDIFFKASAPVIAHEPAITQALYRWRPECIPQVLAIDEKQGWMLMTDGGQRVREAFGTEGDIRHWNDILTAYADLQMDLIKQVDILLKLGSRDRRLVRLPNLYQELLSDTEWLLIDQQEGVTSSAYQRLKDVIPLVDEICQCLIEYAIPESLHHNDLHDGNIFTSNGQFIFFDWGDSSISHPFFSLRTAFISIENNFGLDEWHPAFDQLSRVYLEPWRKYQTERNLLAAFKLARQLWAISSAIKYKTMLSQMPSFRSEYSGAIPSLLIEFLDAISATQLKI